MPELEHRGATQAGESEVEELRDGTNSSRLNDSAVLSQLSQQLGPLPDLNQRFRKRPARSACERRRECCFRGG
jgi:hypothetical protein